MYSKLRRIGIYSIQETTQQPSDGACGSLGLPENGPRKSILLSRILAIQYKVLFPRNRYWELNPEGIRSGIGSYQGSWLIIQFREGWDPGFWSGLLIHLILWKGVFIRVEFKPQQYLLYFILLLWKLNTLFLRWKTKIPNRITFDKTKTVFWIGSSIWQFHWGILNKHHWLIWNIEFWGVLEMKNKSSTSKNIQVFKFINFWMKFTLVSSLQKIILPSALLIMNYDILSLHNCWVYEWSSNIVVWIFLDFTQHLVVIPEFIV